MDRLKGILEETSVFGTGQFAEATLDRVARWTKHRPGEGHSDEIYSPGSRCPLVHEAAELPFSKEAGQPARPI
jgi:hypothetical protein